MEEESSAIALEEEAEDLFSESASEEFESLAARADGETKEVKAQRVMKESLGHGMHALGLAIHSLATSILIVYILLMRVLLKVMVPCARSNTCSCSCIRIHNL